MADFNREEAQQYQNERVARITEIYRTLGREVIDYYNNDRVDDEADARENLLGMRKWVRMVRDDLGQVAQRLDERIG